MTDLLPGQPERRRRTGVPRAVGGARVRDGGAAARAWPVHLAASGPRRLSAEIDPAQQPVTRHGDTYYHDWLAALERLVAEKGGPDQESQARTQEAWRRAAARTPHGRPIELKPSDFP